jgi:hypothetical protein
MREKTPVRTAIIEKAVEAVERARNAAKNNKDSSIQPIWDEMVKNELISEMIYDSLRKR